MPLNHASKYAQLTEKQFELLGRAVVEWSNVEFLLGQLLTRLLLTPEFLGRTYTDQLNAHRIEVAINNSLEVHRNRYNGQLVTEDIQIQIKDMLSSVQSTRSLRNKFSHFCWSRSSDDKIFGTRLSGETSQSPKHDSSYLILSNEELEQFCQNSYDIVEEITALIDKMPEITEEEAVSILRNKGT